MVVLSMGNIMCHTGDTFGAPCKALSISNIAIFRVAKIPTLKTPKAVIISDLRVALNTFSSSLGFHYISRLAAANIGCASEK